MIKKACNKIVLVFRDEAAVTAYDLPSGGQEKPHSGTIHAVGSLVEDEEIKLAIGQKALFHPGVGWDIVYEEVTYLVLSAHEIIAIP
jgi:co-chaperonin GroES (HSP10)